MSEKPSPNYDELARALDQLLQANEKSANALLVLSHQASAGMLVNALLVRELGRAGIVDVNALRAEAVARAEELGVPIAETIQRIFGVDQSHVPEIATPSTFMVIPGGRTDL